MQAGVDGTCWSNERGYGRFAREIVQAMAVLAPDDQFVCFVDRTAAGRLPSYPPNVREVLVETRAGAAESASSTGYRSPADMLAMTRAVWKEPLDVFFSPSVYTYFPLPPGLRTVVTIHDAIAERFPALTLASLRARTFWRAKVWLALVQARRILTVSDYAAHDVERVHRVPRKKIDVALEAPAALFRPRDSATVHDEVRAAGIPEGARYFIYVGGFSPHKNIPSIIRAHAAVVARLPNDPPHLILVGTLDKDVFLGDMPAIREAIARAGTESLIHWPGFVSDERLSSLHTGALALLIPSAAEGFGLPAVEAAACGTPVIATVESPLPQLLDGGGIFVVPGDDAALADAMSRFATDAALRIEAGQRALTQASVLTWERGARSALGSLAKARA